MYFKCHTHIKGQKQRQAYTRTKTRTDTNNVEAFFESSMLCSYSMLEQADPVSAKFRRKKLAGVTSVLNIFGR